MTFLESYQKALKVIIKKPIMLWGVSLLSGVISILASIVTSPIIVLGCIASYLITVGMAKVYIDGLNEKPVNSDQIFAAFNSKFLRVAGGMAWKDLWLIIWCLIPIVGPIVACVKSYSYRFVPYILITKPDVTATQALRLSMQMTNGKKAQMFLADLCFIGGTIVALLILSLFAAIPVLGVLFTLALAVLIIALALFSSIFMGLYGAAFYVDACEPKAQPVVEAPVAAAQEPEAAE